jgi:hypothetical protein
MTADLEQTARLPQFASVETQLANLVRGTEALTAQRDAERDRANAALDRVAELERDLVAERAARRGTEARAQRAEEAARLLRLGPTLELPRCVEPAAGRRRLLRRGRGGGL